MSDRDKLKRHTPPVGVQAQLAVPRNEFTCEEITGQITEPEALAEARARRPTKERLGRLEVSHDKIAADVGALTRQVGEVHGEMKVWPQLVQQLKETVDRSLQQQHMTFTAKVDIDKQAAAADVEVARLEALAKIEDAKADKAHHREESKADNAVKRDLYKEYALKALAGIVGLGGLVGVFLAGRGC